MSFKELEKFVEELKSTTSTLDKVEIIKNCNSDFIKKIILYTYHPFKQYHVTSKNLKKRNDLSNFVTTSDFFSLLDDLSSRELTGHDAIKAVNAFVSNNSEYEELIHCVIDKDLKTRTAAKLINKAWPNFIPEFSVALADNYAPKLVSWNDEWYVSRKLDGVRCIAVIDDLGNPTFYSRTGKEFDTLDVVASDIRNLKLKNQVFDGELCLVDEDGNEDFQGVMKQLKKKDHTIANPSYKIFDLLNLDEFNSKIGERNLSQRLKRLSDTLLDDDSNSLSVLEQEIVQGDVHFENWISKSKENGWEGCMLRKNTAYKGKRSKDLLKCKSFYDDEYEVLSIETGPFRYVKNGSEIEEEMLSAVIVEHKGYEVRVGSGWSVEQRQEYFKNPEEIIGKLITVQYFEETKNQSGGISLRFPTIKHVYGNSRDL